MKKKEDLAARQDKKKSSGTAKATKAAAIAAKKKRNAPDVVATEVVATSEVEGETKAPKKTRTPRSKKYVTSRAFVDRTSTYPVEEAITLVRKTHYAKFPGTVEAHLVLRDEGMNVDVTYPHTTGQKVTVAVATDALMAEIEKGVINFNVLVAHPSFMPKLAKLARVLGPKGLMPNPKNGTITPDPEKRKKELEGGATVVKGEKKAPLAHVVLGKLTMTDKQLSENLKALLAAYPVGKLLRCTISATMGPGIKVSIQ